MVYWRIWEVALPLVIRKATAFGTRETGGPHWARPGRAICWVSIQAFIRWVWKSFGLGVRLSASLTDWQLFQ